MQVKRKITHVHIHLHTHTPQAHFYSNTQKSAFSADHTTKPFSQVCGRSRLLEKCHSQGNADEYPQLESAFAEQCTPGREREGREKERGEREKGRENFFLILHLITRTDWQSVWASSSILWCVAETRKTLSPNDGSQGQNGKREKGTEWGREKDKSERDGEKKEKERKGGNVRREQNIALKSLLHRSLLSSPTQMSCWWATLSRVWRRYALSHPIPFLLEIYLFHFVSLMLTLSPFLPLSLSSLSYLTPPSLPRDTYSQRTSP